MKIDQTYTKTQLTWLMILRIFIGWHFLFEGIVKVTNPSWTAKAYLLDSHGFASSFFVGLTQNDSVLNFVNFANEWALVLIGLGLICGCFYRLSSFGGVVLLLMYTLSHPSFVGPTNPMPIEGSYLWIDKNLIECAGICLLWVFPTSEILGFDRWLGRVCPFLRKIKFI